MRTSQILATLLAFGTFLIGQTPGCKLEIAYVKDFKGTWNDEEYGHQLRTNQPICDDSRIVRVKNKKAKPDDFLLLTDRQARDLPPYQCKHLLGCEAPLDLSDLARETKRQLGDQTPAAAPRASIRSTLSGKTSGTASSGPLTADQLREYNRVLEENLDRVRRVLEAVAGRDLNPELTQIVIQIQTFRKQAEQAREQNLVTAINLARRADLLAQDL